MARRRPLGSNTPLAGTASRLCPPAAGLLAALLSCAGAALARPAAPSPEGGRRLVLVEGATRLDADFLVIVGAVENRSGGWIKGVRVDVELLDAAGAVIHADRVYTSRERIPPGESGPFRYTRSLGRIQGRYASHRLDVSAVPSPSDANAAIEDVTQVRSEPWFEVRGALRSTGSAPCRTPGAVVGAYAPGGRLLEVADVPVEAPQAGLPPGARVPFRALIDPHGEPAEIKVWASCGG